MCSFLGRQFGTTNPFGPANPFGIPNPFTSLFTQPVYEYATCVLQPRGSGYNVNGIVRFRQQMTNNQAMVSNSVPGMQRLLTYLFLLTSVFYGVLTVL